MLDPIGLSDQVSWQAWSEGGRRSALANAVPVSRILRMSFLHIAVAADAISLTKVQDAETRRNGTQSSGSPWR
jgi:hypothetical protein